MIEPVSDNILNLVNDLYNNLDAKDKIINEQALEIARLKEDKKKAIEYIKSYNSTIKSRNELGIYVDFMSIPKELLEILGDKENESS